eukprot:TRINITY_DN26204_c0_g1_i1.p1 TRINITY_DN26204_c0_g1~~TRINITY_DN26204_c0_g1_i1.p1  ORF type:complete len:763 (+),score=214.76 TRINITY_DN26204_c0_g1_i1:71-2359(+)
MPDPQGPAAVSLPEASLDEMGDPVNFMPGRPGYDMYRMRFLRATPAAHADDRARFALERVPENAWVPPPGGAAWTKHPPQTIRALQSTRITNLALCRRTDRMHRRRARALLPPPQGELAGDAERRFRDTVTTFGDDMDHVPPGEYADADPYRAEGARCFQSDVVLPALRGVRSVVAKLVSQSRRESEPTSVYRDSVSVRPEDSQPPSPTGASPGPLKSVSRQSIRRRTRSRVSLGPGSPDSCGDDEPNKGAALLLDMAQADAATKKLLENTAPPEDLNMSLDVLEALISGPLPASVYPSPAAAADPTASRGQRSPPAMRRRSSHQLSPAAAPLQPPPVHVVSLVTSASAGGSRSSNAATREKPDRRLSSSLAPRMHSVAAISVAGESEADAPRRQGTNLRPRKGVTFTKQSARGSGDDTAADRSTEEHSLQTGKREKPRGSVFAGPAQPLPVVGPACIDCLLQLFGNGGAVGGGPDLTDPAVLEYLDGFAAMTGAIPEQPTEPVTAVRLELIRGEGAARVSNADLRTRVRLLQKRKADVMPKMVVESNLRRLPPDGDDGFTFPALLLLLCHQQPGHVRRVLARLQKGLEAQVEKENAQGQRSADVVGSDDVQREIREMFAMYDEDGNGAISREEFRTMVATLELPVGEADQIFDICADPATQRISLSGFTEMMQDTYASLKEGGNFEDAASAAAQRAEPGPDVERVSQAVKCREDVKKQPVLRLSLPLGLASNANQRGLRMMRTRQRLLKLMPDFHISLTSF